MVKLVTTNDSEQTIGATVQAVVDTVSARIRSEEYPTDSRLPSERNLAVELGVARNTVREALEILETQKMIRRRPGSGSFVTYTSQSSPVENDYQLSVDATPLDHLVFRGIVEPEMMRLAVLNMTPRMINSLSQTLSKLESESTNTERFIELEEELFMQIAAGSGNPLIKSCYEMIIDGHSMAFRNKSRRRYLTPRRIQDYHKRYNTLLNAIISRDISSAVEFIKLYLIEEQKLLMQDL